MTKGMIYSFKKKTIYSLVFTFRFDIASTVKIHRFFAVLFQLFSLLLFNYFIK